MGSGRNYGPGAAADRRMRGWPALAALLLLPAAGCAAAVHASAFRCVPVVSQVSHFQSAGHRIRVDIYRPASPGPHPAAIVVHGSSGVHTRIPNTATRYARALAEQGFEAFVVHYFDATGTILASRAAETAHYLVWQRVLVDAVAWARRFDGVDPAEVGMLGHSLGAFLAVGAAAVDPGVHRIVLLGGGLEPFLLGKVQRLPPTLVCHGEQDEEVPLAEAEFLAGYLREHGCAVQLVTYPCQGHTFSEPAISDALTRAARFLSSPRQEIH
jgi:dienelactone hydrolase